LSNAYINATAIADWRQFLNAAGDVARLPSGALVEGLDAVSERESVALGKFVSNLEKLAETAGAPGISWSAGQSARASMDGPVGKAVLSARTLGEGLLRLCEFYHLLQDSTLLKLEVDEQWAVLSYKILDPDIWPRHEDAMYTLGIFSKLIKASAPGAWPDAEVSFEAELQSVRRELGGVVQARVVYGAWANSIRFPASALNMPLAINAPQSDALLAEISDRASEKLLSTPLRTRVEQSVFAAIEEGAACEEIIARALGVSERTLRRQLAEEGATFRKILEQCRMRAAAHYLRRTNAFTLSEIAFRIGYSDQSNFTRAFSRWAGVAPNAWRRTVASDDPASH